MLFSLTAAALLSAASVRAVDHLVTVGGNGTLTFNPTNVTAATGDNIVFTFASKNHTATQSTFTSPCAPSAGGLNSGFMFVDPTATGAAPLNFTAPVTDATTPMWFYCAQTNPVSHCQAGMVFAVNPSADKTFDAFQSAAKASTGTPATGTPTTGTTGTPAAGTTGTPAAGTTGTPAAGNGTGTGTGAPAATNTSPAGGSGNNTGGALQLGGSAAGALAVAAMFLGIAL